MDCVLPGPSIHGILQARILESVAMSSSRGSSQPRYQTQVSCIAGRFFTVWATREAQKYWSGCERHAYLFIMLVLFNWRKYSLLACLYVIEKALLWSFKLRLPSCIWVPFRILERCLIMCWHDHTLFQKSNALIIFCLFSLSFPLHTYTKLLVKGSQREEVHLGIQPRTAEFRIQWVDTDCFGGRPE